MLKEKNSVFYNDKNIKKIRLISNIFFALGGIILVTVFLIWKEEYSLEIDNFSFDYFFKMPVLAFVISAVMFLVGSVLHHIAVIKSVVTEFKKDDNSFLK